MCFVGFELTCKQTALDRWPDTSVVETNAKERNPALLAVITLLCNRVSSSRLHTLILRERYGRARGSKWVNGIIIWETEGEETTGYLCVDADQWCSLCISTC